MRDWVGADTVPVVTADAQARAKICLDCPCNVSGIKLTDAIADAIKQQVELKNHLELHVDGEEGLATCSVCDCANKLQIWCPDKMFQRHYTRADAIRYPEPCWKRKLIEQNL